MLKLGCDLSEIQTLIQPVLKFITTDIRVIELPFLPSITRLYVANCGYNFSRVSSGCSL
jgi:hypothetical protein